MKLIIDAPFMLHRAEAVAAGQNQIGNGFMAYLFLRSIIKTIREQKPSATYCCWDRGVPAHRTATYEGYKAHRVKDLTNPVTIDYIATMGALHEQLPLLGIHSIAVPGVEADDLGYFYASQYHPGVLVSDDWDWVLNMHPFWTLHRPRAKRDIPWDEIAGWYNNDTPRQSFLIFKALQGDGSDEIPGLGFRKRKCEELARDPFYSDKLSVDDLVTLARNMVLMDTSWILSMDGIHDLVAACEHHTQTPTSISMVSTLKQLCMEHKVSSMAQELHPYVTQRST